MEQKKLRGHRERMERCLVIVYIGFLYKAFQKTPPTPLSLHSSVPWEVDFLQDKRYSKHVQLIYVL